MSNFIKIGEYQLANLQKNKLKFLLLDLRPANLRASQGAGHALLEGSQAVAPEAVLSHVQSTGISPTDPIVILCENGVASSTAAEALENSGYINVFVIDGGISQSLTS